MLYLDQISGDDQYIINARLLIAGGEGGEAHLLDGSVSSASLQSAGEISAIRSESHCLVFSSIVRQSRGDLSPWLSSLV